jgi:hypothetical protein
LEKTFRMESYFRGRNHGSKHEPLHFGDLLFLTYRGDCLGPMTLVGGHYPSSKESIHTGTFPTFSWTPYLSLELGTGSKRIVLLSNGPSARR